MTVPKDKTFEQEIVHVLCLEAGLMYLMRTTN